MQPQPTEPRLLYLDPRLLEPDEENVRREPGDLAGLAASLRRYGVLQPLGVMQVGATLGVAGGGPPSSAAPPPVKAPAPAFRADAAGSPPGDATGQRYRVVYGNRRRAAAILAGLATVPCLPITGSDSPDHLVTQLLENMQRRDLNDLEKAEGLARLRHQVAGEPGSAGGDALDRRVADLMGLSPRTVRRYLALRDLPPAVRDLLSEERLTVTQAQHLAQLPAAHLQEQVALRAAEDGWTAAAVSRVCGALVRAPDLSLDQAAQAAGSGWDAVERLGAAPRAPSPAAASVPAKPRRAPKVPEPADDDADLWHEDATGAPTPEATGERDPFAAGGASGGPARAHETADGHRVFRIRTLAAFCDEVDRLARCVQDGDLSRAVRAEAGATTRLKLAAKQLAFTLQGVEALAG